MEANRILLEKKYTRIIMYLAEKKKIPVEEALRIFYDSKVYQMLSRGEADMHCRSDYYILDEILLEVEYSRQVSKGFTDRMMAYEMALFKINSEKSQEEE